MLVSLVSLEYGSMSGERAPLALFLILRYVWLLPPFFYPLLSLATIAGYWLWFLYLKYLKMESEASKEVKRKCTIVNLLEIILLFEKSLNRVALLIMVSLAQRAHSV